MKVIKIYENGGRAIQDKNSPNTFEIDGKGPIETVDATEKNIKKYIGREKFDKMVRREIKPQK